MQVVTQKFDLFTFVENDRNYSNFTAIIYNGKPLINENTPDGPIRINKDMKGKLSVAAFDNFGNKVNPKAAIGFKVGIKDHRTNTLWMFSEQTFYEVDLADLLKECEWGDSLILMTVDRTYRLPRHELLLNDGC